MVEWSDVITIGLLVLLEGLLSADNALVLAVLVLGLPKDQQKKALRYGILGAFFFRAVATLLAVYLIELSWIGRSSRLPKSLLPQKRLPRSPSPRNPSRSFVLRWTAGLRPRRYKAGSRDVRLKTKALWAGRIGSFGTQAAAAASLIGVNVLAPSQGNPLSC